MDMLSSRAGRHKHTQKVSSFNYNIIFSTEEKEHLLKLCSTHHSCFTTVKKEVGSTSCLTSCQAVCCPDGNHCCPAQYRCDEQSASCITGDSVMSWFPKLPAALHMDAGLPVALQDVPCDKQSSCKDGETCCRTSPTTWGCCPSPQVQEICVVFIRV